MYVYVYVCACVRVSVCVRFSWELLKLLEQRPFPESVHTARRKEFNTGNEETLVYSQNQTVLPQAQPTK